MKSLSFLLIVTTLLFGCQGPSGQSNHEAETATVREDPESAAEGAAERYAPASVDDVLAANIANFLVNDYLADDIAIMDSSDRVFQLYKVDLNEDGSEEIFVRFMTRWFCGSGGCTFLLLDNDGEVITRFTVTRPPIFVEPAKQNGWSVLLVKDQGVFKELVFENGSYPANPSLLGKAPYDAPSGHAEVLFSEEFSPARTYSF